MEKGAAVHEKLPREFAELFQAKQAHNVSRADDPPTVGLAAFARAAIQGVPNPLRKSLLILNFALWSSYLLESHNVRKRRGSLSVTRS